MHRWYSNADICYAYLLDVPTLYSVRDPAWDGLFDVKKRFAQSRWFSRGWTLQELLAPSILEFFAQDWTSVGLRSSLKNELAKITNINILALESCDLSTFRVAERMSWAAQRETSRIEDKAYCLLGIFGVNIPLQYGEGERAFIRLQEEILKTSEDYTIFSWSAGQRHSLIAPGGLTAQPGLLADGPGRFRVGFGEGRYSNVVPVPRVQLRRPGNSPLESLKGLELVDDSPPSLTGRGLRICLPLLEVPNEPDLYDACLRCQLSNSKEYLFIVLKRIEFQVFEKVLSFAGKALPITTRQLSHDFKLYTVYVPQQAREETVPRTRLASGMIKHASDLYSEGLELFRQQNYEEAEEYLERALVIRKRILPQDVDDTLCSLVLLREAYERYDKHKRLKHITAELWEVHKRIGVTQTRLDEDGTVLLLSTTSPKRTLRIASR